MNAIADVLVSAVLEFLGGQDILTLSDVRDELEREIVSAGPGALVGLKERLTADVGWDYIAPDPLVRRIHHLLAERFLDPESALSGGEHLSTLEGRPVVFASNHLSYADANVIEVLLQRSGLESWAVRLTALAGPKVFTSRTRRFSSLCFGTVKVPQSADVSSEEAAMSPRDVARAARHAIEVAHKRLEAGDALILFGEGTRSRSGGMQPILGGVARYLERPGTWVVPTALIGSETFFAVGDTTIRPSRVMMTLGAPISADALFAAANGDRRLVVDAVGLAIAGELPQEYRGTYGDGEPFTDARQALMAARLLPGSSSGGS
ncbi:MAG: lysophospholipid acyltransferase family protein [Vicinamibacterales bacterium]